jgi:Holliday junction resolvase YEN1
MVGWQGLCWNASLAFHLLKSRLCEGKTSKVNGLATGTATEQHCLIQTIVWKNARYRTTGSRRHCRKMCSTPPPVAKIRSNKRKQQPVASDPAEVVTTKERPRKAARSNTNNHQNSSIPHALSPTTPKKQEISHNAIIDVIELSDSEEELRIPVSRFNRRSSEWSAVSRTVDLVSSSLSNEASDIMVQEESRSLAAVQTPSRVDLYHPRSPLNLFEIEEEQDLQLALQLSVCEHASLSSTLNKSAFAGASSLGTSTYDEPVYNPPSLGACGEEQTRIVSSSVRLAPRTWTEETPTHTMFAPTTSDGLGTGATGTEDLELNSDSHYDNGAFKSSSRVPGSNYIALERATLHSLPSAFSTIEDIRAARVRHFQSSSATTTVNSRNQGIAQPIRTLRRSDPSNFLVPAGMDFIDLTAD